VRGNTEGRGKIEDGRIKIEERILNNEAIWMSCSLPVVPVLFTLPFSFFH
jgi:hypothetical protein